MLVSGTDPLWFVGHLTLCHVLAWLSRLLELASGILSEPMWRSLAATLSFRSCSANSGSPPILYLPLAFVDDRPVMGYEPCS